MNVFIKNLQHKIPIPNSKIKSAVLKASRQLSLECRELSFVFVGMRRMRMLNKKHLGHDYVTDVITFKHGEIVICPLVAVNNSKKYQNSVDKELVLYVVHGMLHLAGYDDHQERDVVRMRAKESQIMDKL